MAENTGYDSVDSADDDDANDEQQEKSGRSVAWPTTPGINLVPSGSSTSSQICHS